MRLWHKDLIPALPRQQLLGQWRELCAIMSSIEEKGTPNHVLVNKVMNYPPEHLYGYADLVYEQMHNRGYRCYFSRFAWPFFGVYGGSRLYPSIDYSSIDLFPDWMTDRYLRQCYYNLEEKRDCGAISDEEFAKVRGVCERVL